MLQPDHSSSFHRPFLSRTQTLVLGGAVLVYFFVSLFTPSRPYFVAPWHMALTSVAVGAALSALIGWARAKFGVPARSQVRWRVGFWLLWLALAVSLAPAVSFHLAQANYLPLVRLLSGLVAPMVVVYILLHLARPPSQEAQGADLASRDA